MAKSTSSKGQKIKPKKKRGGALGRIGFAILVTAAVLMLAFFLVMRDQGKTSVAENAAGSIFAPIQNAVSSATKYIRDVVAGVKDYYSISIEYEKKKLEVNDLKLQLQALEEAALENERLTDLLDAHDRYEAMDPIYAKVIAREPGVWFDSFSINRGSMDGITVNMAVVTGGGLVGRVYETGLSYAKVLSIIDTRSAVACLIERTRDNGVLRGQISDSSSVDSCNMYYLPVVNDIVPGDVVLTSGVDTLFPKGITVGSVSAVSRQSDLSDQYIVVAPAADFLHIEEVLVLRTVVETDEALPVLPTPTPKPTPTPELTPEPLLGADATPEATESPFWSYPTALPDGYDPNAPVETPSPEPSPSPTFDPSSMLPEDEWAM